jgi:putative tryptophan/tyrosine transport system substrate-binding protein
MKIPNFRYCNKYIFMLIYFTVSNLAIADTYRLALFFGKTLPTPLSIEIERIFSEEFKLRNSKLNNKNSLEIKAYTWEDQRLQAPMVAKQIVNEFQPTVIYTDSIVGVKALREQTSTIPIVFGVIGDPVRFGVLDEPGKPKDNMTGYTIHLSLIQSTVQLLSSGLIGRPIKNIALVSTETIKEHLKKEYNDYLIEHNSGQTEKSKLALSYYVLPPEITTAQLNLELTKLKSDAVIFIHTTEISKNIARFVQFSNNMALPSVINYWDVAQRGAFLHHVAYLKDEFKVAFDYIYRLMTKSAKPADLKVLGPNAFETVLNETVAKKNNWALDYSKVPDIKIVR